MKIQINKKDYNRLLLTDTLPYELPILCSNEGVYEFIVKKDLPAHLSHLFNQSLQPTIPFSYKIQKDSNSFRTLSIPSISTQLRTCNFYKKYEHILLHMCGRSEISLRYPYKVGSHFYEKNFLKNRINLKNGEVNIEKNGFDEQKSTSSSHFVYKNYNFLYKFYDSYEFHRLERKYKYLAKLDISKFFGHIYTHSVCWAVKSKKFAKNPKNRGSDHFEGALDKLFQDSNYGETNGILIGPEFSRIFSEIILQKIDCNLIKTIEDLYNKSNGDEYVVKRYVDDYFIFSNEKQTIKEIEVTLSSELEHYKLYLNESKKIIIKRPFITGATMAKSQIKLIINEIYESLVDLDAMEDIDILIKDKQQLGILDSNHVSFPLKRIRNKRIESEKFIKNIKLAIKSNEVEFENISSYLLSALKNKFFKVIRLLSLFEMGNHKREVHRFFSILFEMVFFIYSMDNRVRQTYIISQLILEVVNYADRQDSESQEVIKKNLFDEIALCLKNLIPIKNKQVEFSNLLICLNALGEDFRLSQDSLEKMLPTFDNEILDIDYFSICSLIYYIKEKSEYKILKQNILKAVENKFKISSELKIDTEANLLLADMLTCPFLIMKNKIKIFKSYLKIACIDGLKINLSNDEYASIISNFNNRKFFFDWGGSVNLEEILYKKELRTPYE